MALRSHDLDFEGLIIDVKREIYRNLLGNTKTPGSRKPVGGTLNGRRGIQEVES